ncbi:MAG: hypothetical protein OEV44_04655 [Spirochaetota bacterium]|nr:hypothetical protein [Spirochaetota bacterium]
MISLFRNYILNFFNSILLLFIILLFIPNIILCKTEVNNQLDYYKAQAHSVNTINFIEKHFKWNKIIEVMIDSKKPDGIKEPEFLKKIGKFQHYLENMSLFHITNTSSLADIVKTMNQRINKNKYNFYKIPDSKSELTENLLTYNLSVPFGRDLNNQMNVDQSAIRLTIRLLKSSDMQIKRVIRAIHDYSNKYLKDYRVNVVLSENKKNASNSIERINYNDFNKRFNIDKTLLIVFKDEKGVFNNKTLNVIQRLTNKFWKTKYITRVDSLTNYPNIYISGDNLDVRDFIKLKIPNSEELKKLFSLYIKSGKVKIMLIDLLSSILPYSKEKIKDLIKNPVSKENIADLIAETIRLKLPLNKHNLKEFIDAHISSNEQVVKKIMSKFFPTEDEINSFFQKYITKNYTLLRELTYKVMGNTALRKSLILPYLKNNQSADEIIIRLRDFLDKLPPNKKEIEKLIKPYVKGRKASNLLVDVLQTVFPVYYDKRKLKEWILKETLSKENLIQLTSDFFELLLPMTEKELKLFINNYLASNKHESEKIFNTLKDKVFYSRFELNKKKRIAMNDKLIKGFFISNNSNATIIKLSLRIPDFNKKKIDYFLFSIKKILHKENKRSGYQFYITGF